MLSNNLLRVSHSIYPKFQHATRSGIQQNARCLSATAYVLPPIRPTTTKPATLSDPRSFFTRATGQTSVASTPQHVVHKTPLLTRQLAQTAQPLVAYNTAHSAAPPAPGADFNVLMIGAGVRKRSSFRFDRD